MDLLMVNNGEEADRHQTHHNYYYFFTFSQICSSFLSTGIYNRLFVLKFVLSTIIVNNLTHLSSVSILSEICDIF